MHREDEHPGLAAVSRHLLKRPHAPDPRHGEVQQGHIRFRFPCRLNGLLSIGSFRDNFHIGLGIDQHFQSGAENCVIIRDHDSDLVCSRRHFRYSLRPTEG